MTCSSDIAVPGWAEGAARDPLDPRNEQLPGRGSWRFMDGGGGGWGVCGARRGVFWWGSELSVRCGGFCMLGVWRRMRSRSAISRHHVVASDSGKGLCIVFRLR